MNVTLREVARENWRACVRLEVAPEQRNFVAPNAVSLAQAHYEPWYTPLGVYDGDRMVGFVMYGRLPDDGHHWIMRLMVDAEHQGKGYGRAAMEATIARMRALPGCDAILISYEPENAVAERLYERLYERLGFVKTGEIIEGETVARLAL